MKTVHNLNKKMMNKKTAQEKAEALCELLSTQFSGTWEPHVWENLGWHYRAELKEGSIGVVYNPTTKRYRASMKDEIGSYSGTPMIWYDGNGYETPFDAVINQLSKATSVMKRINNVVETNLNAIENNQDNEK